MAIFQIIGGGVSTIDLNSTTGFEILEWFPETPQDDEDLQETMVEDMGVKLTATDIDDMAAQLQGLKIMLRKAQQFQEGEFQTTPVYLKIQGTDETNPRYALVYAGQVSELQSELEYVVEQNTVMTDIRLEIERGSWQDAIPGVYPGAKTLTQAATDGPASPTKVHVANTYTTVTKPDYIFNYDDSEAAFGTNKAGNAAHALFVDSGDIAVSDILYIGFDTLTQVLVFDLAPAGGLIIDVTEAYFNGASWTQVTETGGTLKKYPDGSNPFWDDATDDSIRVWALQAGNWATTTINGQLAYWLRFTVSSVTSAGTLAQQNNQIFCQNKNFIIIPSTVIDGDLPPLTNLTLAHGQGDDTPAFSTPSRIIMGLNSRSVTLFDSIIPSQDVGPNAANWAYTLGTDAANADYSKGIGNKVVTVSYGTATNVNRLQMHASANDAEAAYYGKHRVFILCEQIGGDDGDTSVQFQAIQGGSTSDPIGNILSAEVDLKTQDAGAEAVDMGLIDIPGAPITAQDDLSSNALFLRINSARSAGSSTLRIYALVLIPASEWVGVLDSPILETDNKSSSLNRHMTVEMDSGIVRQRIMKGFNVTDGSTITNQQVVGNWNLLTDYPILEPSTAYYMHFLILRYAGAGFGTGPYIADIEASLLMELRTVDRYASLRGED